MPLQPTPTEGDHLVLIHPPVALPSEPPPGLAALAGRLRVAGLRVALVDANVEALQFLLDSLPARDDGQGHTHGQAHSERSLAEQRALLHRRRSLEHLRGPLGYQNRDRHYNAVGTLRRLLGLAVEGPARVDLADYQDPALSPFRSADLRQAATQWEQSPFADYFRQLAARVARARPRAVGLSINHLNQALPGMALAGALSQLCGQTPLLVGGSLIGCWKDRLQPEALGPPVQRLVFGDGTAALLQAAGHGGPVPASGQAPPDHAGWPWELYLAPRRVAPLATSEGCCWGRCRYCPEALGGEPFAALPPPELPAWIDSVRRGSEAGLLHLTDAAIPPSSLELLAGQRWDARWYGFTRFFPLLGRPGVAAGLRRGGCQMLQLGLESASPRVLRRLNKGIDLQQAARILEQLAEAGIPVYLYLMFGVPGEDRADAEQTLEFVTRHADKISFLHTSLLNLPLASPPEPDLRRSPYPGDHDLNFYCGFDVEGDWDRKAARLFLERELARHPRVAPILRRTPRVFGANHAPFMKDVY